MWVINMLEKTALCLAKTKSFSISSMWAWPVTDPTLDLYQSYNQQIIVTGTFLLSLQ